MNPEQTYKQEEVDSKPLDRQLLKKLWHYIAPYRYWIWLAVFLLVISNLIKAVVPIAIGQLTQELFDHAQAATEEKEKLLAYFTTASIALASLLLVGYLFDVLNTFLRSWIGQRGLYALRLQVFSHIQHLSMRYFDGASVGRLMTRTIHDVDQINQMFSESIIPIIGNLLLFASMTVGIFFLDWRLGILLVCLFPGIAWLTNRFRLVQRRCYNLVRSIVSAMNGFVQEHLMGVFTIRSFGLLEQEKEQFQEMNEDYCNAYLDSIFNFAFFIAGIDFMQSFALIAVFVVLMQFSQDGFQVGHFITFNLYTLMLFRPLADLAECYNTLQSAMAASERVFEVLHEKVEPVGSKTSDPLQFVDSITFKEVWFAYDEEEWVLKGLSFTIKRGESLAIVGITGSGKTTILNLLLRFYDFQKGSVEVNGKDIRSYQLHELRALFGVILQDPVIFSGTLRDNITLYQPISDEKIQETLDYLEMNALVARLPKGLSEELMERGKSLSVGEMQLVSLARAIAHDRSVLILDEATANIDSETEKVIQHALQKILHDKTTLVIAHRLSTIRTATRILVLSGGIVIEEGSHDELLEAKGVYEKLYRLQF